AIVHTHGRGRLGERHLHHHLETSRMHSLQTQRLILRPFEETDLDDLWALYSDPEVVRYLSSGLLGREETAVRLRRMMDHWQAHGYGIWAVIRKADRRLIG